MPPAAAQAPELLPLLTPMPLPPSISGQTSAPEAKRGFTTFTSQPDPPWLIHFITLYPITNTWVIRQEKASHQEKSLLIILNLAVIIYRFTRILVYDLHT